MYVLYSEHYLLYIFYFYSWKYYSDVFLTIIKSSLSFANRQLRLVLKTVEEDFNKKLGNSAFWMKS